MSGKNNQDQPFIKDLDKLFDKEYKNVLKKNKQQKSPSYRPTASSSFYSGGHDYDDHGTGCFPSMTNIFGSPTYADKVITYVPDNKNYGPGYNLLDKEKAKAFKVEEERRERELYNKTLQMVQTSGATQSRTETEWQTKNQLKESIKTSLQEQLFRIIHTELYSLEQVLTIKTALGDYETRTGTTIFDMGQISDLQHRDPNDTSKLVLYVAKIMEYSVNQINWLKLFEFFGEHIRRIELELTNIVHMTIYNQDKHDRDSESSFVHDALQGELVCTRIRGDGNCLWNSVSTALYGNYSRMESLRLLTATTLVKHRELFENYLDEQKRKFGYNHELSFDGLIRAAMDLQVWGDELHVMALSLALHKPIYSYGSLRLAFDPKFPRHYSELKEAYEQQSIQNHFRYIADEADVGAQPILLYYNGRDHYSVVLPVRDDVVALVPQMQILEPIFKRELKNTGN
ncbi:unnamed protein product [Oppiella nova]|uniref:OTU domain-containing protein n=1 Tax=Oppiella nova TaxID=334625 RepID=A0A7R9M4P0_9ACAR|nr:unnamed protein product [Oppiella nova]CAG2169396.1 unnamed protein product [Oppiella nova]